MDKVVIIDDEIKVLNAVKRLLRKLPYDFEFYSEPEIALEKIISAGTDVVVVDYRMPGMDGLEFLKKLSEAKVDCIKIVMSGEADIRIVAKAINESGIYKFINKPWDPKELINAINESVDQNHRNIVEKHLTEIGKNEVLGEGSSAHKWLSDKE
ncbi:MAG: response regulator [Gammaproteobacteria bacterium]|nr:MAG: response regulator [Gammaproteobacteria bacterium]